MSNVEGQFRFTVKELTTPYQAVQLDDGRWMVYESEPLFKDDDYSIHEDIDVQWAVDNGYWAVKP